MTTYTDKRSPSQVRGATSTYPRSPEGAASFLVDGMLAWGVVASISYWAVLLLRLPVWVWYPLTVCTSIGMLAWWKPKATSRHFRQNRSHWAAMAALVITAAAISLFTNRPDLDDGSFFHRALVAAENPHAPIALTDTSHDTPGLPAITPLHVFTSIEVVTALLARFFHIPQIIAIHLVLGTIANVMLPIVYFLVLRSFNARTGPAIFGTAVALAFLLICGDSHRDWGNFTIVRSWQGKCMLMALILPLSLMYALRFLLRGRKRDLLRLHATICCGIGLSGTALFLLPFVVGLAAVATWISTRFQWFVGRRVLLSTSILALPMIVSVLPWLGALPRLGDISFFLTGGWPTSRVANLGLVITVGSAALYTAYVTVLLICKPAEVKLRAFAVYTGLVALLLLVPVSGNLLMRIVTPGAYWRFAYAFMAPLLAGVTVIAVSARHGARPRWMRLLMGTILVAATAFVKTPVFDQDIWAVPGPKFPRQDMAAVESLADDIPTNSVILTDAQLMTDLGLLRPDLRFTVTRPEETTLAFTSLGLKPEGRLRAQIGSALMTCRLDTLPSIDLLDHWPGIYAIVYRDSCDTAKLRAALHLDESWHETRLPGVRTLTRAH